MSVDLVNRGLSSAEEIAIELSSNRGFRAYPDTTNWLSDGTFFRGSITIHPDQTVRWLHNCTNDVRSWTDDGLVIQFGFRIFSRNAPPTAFELSFTGKELCETIRAKPIEKAAQLIGT
jgi:hypothetical protein